MIKNRKFLGTSMARRGRRRWLVVGFWALILTFVVIFPPLFRDHEAFFERPFFWVFFPLLILTSVLGGESRKGLVRDFHGHTSDEGSRDYSFMTPEDIAAREEAEKQNRLDEREVIVRNAAHYRAFEVLRWISPLVWVAAGTEPFKEAAYMRQSLLLFVVLVIQTLPLCCGPNRIWRRRDDFER
jgi:hypothetical protein